MSTDQSSNKRIAKNTLMLYIRMLISMLVGLYTSRVVLQTLGVEDYGIYGVVGGAVSMMGFLRPLQKHYPHRWSVILKKKTNG